MEWANARKTIFSDFMREMSAERLNLMMNFRSAPRLVALQNHLANALLQSADVVQAAPHWDSNAGKTLFCLFNKPEEEWEYIYQSIHHAIHTKGVAPRDIVVLAKLWVPVYAGDLIVYLNNKGIKIRDESDLQDLLTEELSRYVLNMLYAVFKKGAGKEKDEAFTFLSIINTEFEDAQLLKLYAKLMRFLNDLKEHYAPPTISKTAIDQLINSILNFAGIYRIRSVYSQYKDSSFANELINKLKRYVGEYFAVTPDMVQCLDQLMGIDSVGVMTIHKSKGLEFHTVFFVGFEDEAFWSYSHQADQDKRAFFVALSRAKEEAFFTFCKERKDRYGRRKTQQISKIREIFEALQASGMVEIYEHKT